MPAFSDLNWLAVLVATIANMMLGALWYSPVLFSQKWMELRGVTMEEIQANASNTMYIWPALSSLVSATLLSILIHWTNTTDLAQGLVLGLIGGIFSAATIGTNFVFESRKLALYFLTIGYHVVGFLIMSVIVTLWQ